MCSFVYRTCLTVLLVGVAGPVHAQIDNVSDLLRGGVDDANKLLQAYLEPIGQGFGANLNSSWFSTARPHALLGFDITITANAAIAPRDATRFDLTALSLETVRPAAGGPVTTPTVVGDDSPGPAVDLVLENPSTGQEEVIANFVMPEGLGYRYVPAPMVQAAVGLGIGTDAVVRFVPELNFDDETGSVQLWGIGAKHSLNQWFGVEQGEGWDVSLAGGYTSFQAQSTDLDVEPDPGAVQSGASYEEQQIELEAVSFMLALVASRKYSILTIFGSAGYEQSSVDLKLKGTFPITSIQDDRTDPDFGRLVVQDFVDPVDLTFDGENRFRGTAGFRLDLLFLAIHGSYTFAKYPVATAGVAIDIR